MNTKELLQQLENSRTVLYTPVDRDGTTRDDQALELALVPMPILEKIKNLLEKNGRAA